MSSLDTKLWTLLLSTADWWDPADQQRTCKSINPTTIRCVKSRSYIVFEPFSQTERLVFIYWFPWANSLPVFVRLNFACSIQEFGVRKTKKVRVRPVRLLVGHLLGNLRPRLTYAYSTSREWLKNNNHTVSQIDCRFIPGFLAHNFKKKFKFNK